MWAAAEHVAVHREEQLVGREIPVRQESPEAMRRGQRQVEVRAAVAIRAVAAAEVELVGARAAKQQRLLRGDEEAADIDVRRRPLSAVEPRPRERQEHHARAGVLRPKGDEGLPQQGSVLGVHFRGAGWFRYEQDIKFCLSWQNVQLKLQLQLPTVGVPEIPQESRIRQLM